MAVRALDLEHDDDLRIESRHAAGGEVGGRLYGVRGPAGQVVGDCNGNGQVEGESFDGTGQAPVGEDGWVDASYQGAQVVEGGQVGGAGVGQEF